MCEFDKFFENFPLAFVGRDLSNSKETISPSSLADARSQILKKQTKNPAEIDNAHAMVETMYLNAIGEENNLTEPNHNTNNKINDLIHNNLLNATNYGFLNEMEENARSARIKIPEAEINQASYHDLFRFCYAHGVHITHDISLDELQRMTEWISKNETDHVAYTKIPEFMQQAIDLSVIAQNIDKLSDSLAQDTRLTDIIRNHVNESEEKLDLTSKSLTDIAQLNQYLIQDGRTLPAMKFQDNALNSYTEPHVAAPDENFPVESEEQEQPDEENQSNE